jgi:hypothetical protein
MKKMFGCEEEDARRQWPVHFGNLRKTEEKLEADGRLVRLCCLYFLLLVEITSNRIFDSARFIDLLIDWLWWSYVLCNDKLEKLDRFGRYDEVST